MVDQLPGLPMRCGRAASRSLPVRISTARSASASVVVRPNVIRKRTGRPARFDAHRGEHVRRFHRPARTGRGGRGAQVGLVEEEQQRLALHAFDADVRATGDLDVGRDGLADAVDGGDADRRRADRALRRCARTPFLARHRWRRGPQPSPRSPARCASRSAGRVPVHRRRVAGRWLRPCGRRARRHPSARRTCGRSARAGRRAATAGGDRASTPPARHRCAAARSAPPARTTAAAASRSLIEPTSLFTAITETIDTSPSIAASS